jgi:minichromosome maintenance protein 10
MNEVDDLEDDEETLQLKLAAIEAKLKLKKLQQNRQKEGLPSAGRDRSHAERPQSSSGYISIVKPGQNINGFESKAIEVPVSPTRRRIVPIEQRSPGRVLLGIDKGVKGTDVSLRRARSTRENGTFTGSRLKSGTASSRSQLAGFESNQQGRSGQNLDHPIKTFSERMAENRVEEQNREKRREAMASKRGTGFQLNHAEMESFQKAAEEARTHNPPRSALKDRQYATFSREDIVRSQDRHPPASGMLKRSSTMPNFQDHNAGSKITRPNAFATTDSATLGNRTSDGRYHAESGQTRHKGDAALYDPFSQLHLASRILPHPFLERTFPPETHACVRLPQLLRQVRAPAYELPGLDAKDVVIVGVIASKSTPLDHKQGQGQRSEATGESSNDWDKKWEDGSQNQKRFMVLQLSDLTWSVDLYLFGTAVPRYHRLSPGTVVAILNPGIMPPKKGKEDTGAFSLTLHNGEDTLLEIGSARDLGFCVAMKKDGKQCGSWVNLTKTQVCEFHLNVQVTRTQSGRMGVNTGSNAIGRAVSGSRLRNRLVAGARGGRGSKRRILPGNEGRKFDSGSQSHYFMVSSGEAQKQTNCAKKGEFFEKSAAALLELDDDDPFIAEGRLSRDTQSRLKKRLLDQEKELEIADRLTSMGSGGAGGEYLRHRIAPNPDGQTPSSSASVEAGRKKSALATKNDIMRAGTNTNGKRASDSVRLSPMKKTRFLTEKGIREAGRESLGGKRWSRTMIWIWISCDSGGSEREFASEVVE